MKINEFLQKYRLFVRKFSKTRPHIYCMDGFKMSVQAGYGIYSVPACDANYYDAVEIGFPSQKEELIMPYAENSSKPCGTVYSYVPVKIVDQVIEKHGGIDERMLPYIADWKLML